MRCDRATLIADRARDRSCEVAAAIPPLDPELCYWLHEDASESYCREHVVVARGREFDLGAPLTDRHRWERDEWEDAFWEGIGASCDSESDHTEACSRCGKTLSYVLTDVGVQQELAYWLENPLVKVRDEDTYALDRLVISICPSSPRRLILDVAAAVNQAWRIACAPVPA